MVACHRCGEENPDRAKFCLECAAPLAGAASERRERRVVSTLFVDLAGFTGRSESLDVEDVEGFLDPYFAVLREQVERTGGLVAKFTGDGVMALFGALVAHEDDPERAVRCGLLICERVGDPQGPDREHAAQGRELPAGSGQSPGCARGQEGTHTADRQ